MGEGVAPPIVHEVLRSSGQPLDARTRAFMEPRFGHDFSKVRVHTDARAAESAHAVSAHAYTVGNHIVFAQPPSRSGAGASLLAHELTHVVQQGGAGGAASSLRVGETGTPAEREAERVSNAVVSQRGASNPAISSPASIQRASETAQPGHCTPIIPGGGSKNAKADDMVFWQSFYQQAIQGAAGNSKLTAAQKAEHACEVANRCMKIIMRHSDQFECTLKGVTDEKAKTGIYTALGSNVNSDWGDAFRGALQATAGTDNSTMQQVSDAADIADQAALRGGHIDDATWNKYMACKGGGAAAPPAPAPAPKANAG
jgi:hypothetical protein